MSSVNNFVTNFHKLVHVGIALSSQKNLESLLEEILISAIDITNCDGGTLYLMSQEQELQCEILIVKSLNIQEGGTSGKTIEIPNKPLYHSDGSPNFFIEATQAVHENRTINVPNAYKELHFDMVSPSQADELKGYKSISFLTTPMQDHEGEIIGVLQLINALDSETNQIIPFTADDEEVLEALASQAAIAFSNRLLMFRLENLFREFIDLINGAIDDKSPYTGAHCRRVPELTSMIADAVNTNDKGPLKDFKMTDADRYELHIAGLIHDCGKVSTPVHIVDKATKLEKIYDRIGILELRLEIIRRDLEIAFLKGKCSEEDWKKMEHQLIDDMQFLKESNVGSEWLSDLSIRRINQIAKSHQWQDYLNNSHDFITAEEVENLSIRSGTLNVMDRKTINHHIEVTIEMLENLTWPKHLERVPEYAGGHHERMDGRGYPKGLTRDQMSVQARCMAIADVFEALTASDRPYKKGKKLSEALMILGKMKLDQHLDPDIFNVFVWGKVYEQYAKKFLKPEQIDFIDVSQIPGYEAPPVE